MEKPNFVIVAPRYSTQFGGCMAMHDLCDQLNRHGFKAAIVFMHSGNAKLQDFHYALSNTVEFYKPHSKYISLDLENPDISIKEFLEEGVIIYPDMITGNPLNAQRVVRYLLNTNENEFTDEYILTFSTLYRRVKPYDFSLFNVFPHPAIHNNSIPWNERSLDATYYGKGPSFVNCSHIPETLTIERNWPATKEQLGVLLRHTRFMFSWDCVSQTNTDALLSGAIPILLHDQQIPREHFMESELGKYPSVHLNDLTNKSSLEFSRDLINQETKEFMEKYRYYESSYPARVLDFANSCSNFFKF